MLVETNLAYKKNKVAFPEKNDLGTLWLPSADSNHGHGG